MEIKDVKVGMVFRFWSPSHREGYYDAKILKIDGLTLTWGWYDATGEWCEGGEDYTLNILVDVHNRGNNASLVKSPTFFFKGIVKHEMGE